MKNKLGRKNIVAAAVMVFCAAVAVWGGAAYADEIAAKGGLCRRDCRQRKSDERISRGNRFKV